MSLLQKPPVSGFLQEAHATPIVAWSGNRGTNTIQIWIAGPTAAFQTMAFRVSIALRRCGLHVVWAYHGSHNCAQEARLCLPIGADPGIGRRLGNLVSPVFLMTFEDTIVPLDLSGALRIL